VVREVADYLGNTPAVAGASYIDPRIIELYEDGSTIASVLGDLGKNCDFGDLATRGRAETAVVKLLARHSQPGATCGLILSQYRSAQPSLDSLTTGQRPSARASWALFIDERPLTLRRRASE
jgi:hypothetical protein